VINTITKPNASAKTAVKFNFLLPISPYFSQSDNIIAYFKGLSHHPGKVFLGKGLNNFNF